jgi:hypothetical protein
VGGVSSAAAEPALSAVEGRQKNVIGEHNRTADLAVELALSAFGKKIL